jgi:transposase
MRKAPVHIVDLGPEEIEEALALAKTSLPEKTYRVLETIVRAYRFVLEILGRKSGSIGRLRKMLFGPTSEKTEELLGGRGGKRRAESATKAKRRPAGKPRPRPGHGRNGEAAYREAQTVEVPHQKLQAGGRCPGCRKGKVYDQPDPGVLVRVRGQAPLGVTVYHLEKLRCNLCGEVFTARPPEGVGTEKYDATSAAMIALLKYGSGFPFHRLDRLQKNLGLPLPAATQWEIVRDAARSLEGVYEELLWQAAQGGVLHNDDTAMRILAWMGKRREEQPKAPSKGGGNGEGEDLKDDRTGIFTSGIVSLVGEHRIALYFTGRKHAGENLKALLEQRESWRGAPIQMCDALSRNVPKDFKTILANCLAHGRRQFVEVLENFPREVEYVLEVLAAVYKNDAMTKKRRMTALERLGFHQEKSGPLMEKLHAWMERQICEKLTEPNSTLGEAIGYMRKHWEKLTLFLRRPGAPLDNNVVERALKKAILHRKNALFYKTDNGAHVGDLYMSLIHTCEMNGADPFDYLTQLQRHTKEVRAHPERWMPWNYRKALARARSP